MMLEKSIADREVIRHLDLQEQTAT